MKYCLAEIGAFRHDIAGVLANLGAVGAHYAPRRVEVFLAEAEDLAGPQTQQHGDEDYGAYESVTKLSGVVPGRLLPTS